MSKITNILNNPFANWISVLVLSAISLSGKLSMMFSYILLFFALILGCYALYKTINWKKKANSFYAIVPFIIGLVLLALWLIPEETPQNEGVLLFSTEENTPILIEIGNSGAKFLWAGENGEPILDIGDGQYITVEKIENDLFVSTRVKNKDGDQLVEVIRNEWKIAPPPQTWDRNYSENAFELKDARGKIVLQIVLLSDRIQLQGEWWVTPIEGLRIASTGKNKGGTFFYITPKHPTPSTEIQPIFKYPSSKHFGERIDK